MSMSDSMETQGQSSENIYVSRFRVPKMDCPSEENLIRMQLEPIESGLKLEFDIPNRIVRVTHKSNSEKIDEAMLGCGFGSIMEETRPAEEQEKTAYFSSSQSENDQEANTLKLLLAINAFMFVFELTVGWIGQSTGLIADSMDMFADAAVYGLALFAVGKSAGNKLHAAHLAGWLQMILAFGALSEVLRRFIFGSEPVSVLMMGIGCIALVANVSCLFLISKKKDRGAHMRASWIFSANDVIANIGVILAGVLVWWTGSRFPDLVIGLLIGVVVLSGAIRILRIKM